MRHLYYVLYALSTEMSSKNTKNFKNFKKYISKFIFLLYLLFSVGFLRSFLMLHYAYAHIYHHSLPLVRFLRQLPGKTGLGSYIIYICKNSKDYQETPLPTVLHTIIICIYLVFYQNIQSRYC